MIIYGDRELKLRLCLTIAVVSVIVGLWIEHGVKNIY